MPGGARRPDRGDMTRRHHPVIGVGAVEVEEDRPT